MQARGHKYEALGAKWLAGQGLEIIARNYRCHCGELDLIARHRDHLVFVEVRARSNPRFASAAASVDRRKQAKLLRAAQYFLQQHPTLAKMPCRFDVIAFEPRQSDAEPAPVWIRGAFTS